MKKMLLDENLPKPLKKHFSSDFDIITVPDLGWQSKKEDVLLEAMVQAGIEMLITADRNLQYQQNLGNYPIQVIVLLTYDNRYKTLISKMPLIETEFLKLPDFEKVVMVDLR